MSEGRSRRDLLRRAAGVALVISGVGCRRKTVAPFACTESHGLSPDDAQARKTLGYAEPATDAARTCAACQQFVPAPDGETCGACKVLKGPIHPHGTCKVFAVKAS